MPTGRPKTYDLVLAVLRSGCDAMNCSLSVADVAEIASDKMVRALKRAYPTRTPPEATKYVLDRLVESGEVRKHRSHGRPLYAVSGTRELPDIAPRSRRQLTLRLVTAAVEHFGRAVRLTDIREFAAGQPEMVELLDPLAHSLSTLKRFDEVLVISECRGGGAEGRYYYLPAGFDQERFRPEAGQRSWLELVEDAFGRAWRAELARAKDQGTRPQPVLVRTVRAILLADDPESKAKDAQLVTNAMGALAGGSDPILWEVPCARPRFQRQWAPIGVPLAALDQGGAYASDSERLVEGVRRACASSGTPAVTAQMVKREIARDSSLHLQGSKKLHAALTKVASAAALPPAKRGRIRQQVGRVGRVRGHTYYAVLAGEPGSAEREDSLANGRAHVAELNAAQDLGDLRAPLEITNATSARLPSVRIGRLRLLAQRLEDVRAPLLPFRNRPASTQVIQEVEGLIRRIRDLLIRAEDRLAGALPSTVQIPTSGFTSEELVPLFEHVYSGNEKMKEPMNLNRNLWRRCGRVPNPGFSFRTESPEHFFDVTSVYLQLATQSGGREAFLLAGMAEQELGPLRDPRFVLPGLTATDERDRHTAIAALAFLEAADAVPLFYDILMNDPSASVRRSALWAYGMCGGQDMERVVDSLKSDRDVVVRAFATGISSGRRPVDWWIH